MEPRLFRFTTLVSLVLVLVFAFIAVKHYREEISYEKAATQFLSLSQKMQNSCGDTKDLPCANYDYANDPWVQMSQAANGARDTWKVSIAAMIAIPALLFGLFYSGRWVMQGSAKQSRPEA